ncbi:MAG: MATE family efflux transporter [Alphaproteobacteria bacterium]|nr:MATE family efflux transporter [Alphaproteobacteria bacterium]
MLKDITTLLNLAWPVIISRIGIIALSVTDTIMVGQYASAHLAYLGIGLVPSNIAIVILLGLLMGSSVLVSRAYGAGDKTRAGQIWMMSLMWSFLLGIAALIFCAFGEEFLRVFGQPEEIALNGGAVSLIAGLGLPFSALYMTTSFFLEGARNPRPVMVIMIAANIINIFASYVLVYGVYGFPELGAIGSIWASFIIRLFMLVAILYYLFTWFDYKSYGISWQAIRHWLRQWFSTRDYRDVGYASGLSIGLENLAFNTLALFAGMLGLMVAAAHTITITIYIVFYMAGLGLGVATSVNIGNAYGAGDMRMVKRWAQIGMVIIALASAPSVVVMIFWAEDIARLFNRDAQVVALAAALVSYSALALMFDAAQSCLSMSLRAIGDNWFPSYAHTIIYLLLMLPITYVLMFPLERGAFGLIEGLYIGTALPLVAMAWRYHHIMKSLNVAPKKDPPKKDPPKKDPPKKDPPKKDPPK